MSSSKPAFSSDDTDGKEEHSHIISHSLIIGPPELLDQLGYATLLQTFRVSETLTPQCARGEHCYSFQDREDAKRDQISTPSASAIIGMNPQDVEILIYGLIHFTLFHQSVVVALHCDSIMSYYSS
jgi:hypothetical protein